MSENTTIEQPTGAENEVVDNSTPATEPQTVAVNVNDVLQVGEIALAHLGRPAHHTDIIAKAKELGIAGENINSVNPRMWADTRKPEPHVSKFKFYGKSMFGLAAWSDEVHNSWTNHTPTRAAATNTKALTLDQLKAKVTKLETELTAAREFLAKAEADPSILTAQPAAPKEKKQRVKKDKTEGALGAAPAPPVPTAPTAPEMPEDVVAEAQVAEPTEQPAG